MGGDPPRDRAQSQAALERFRPNFDDLDERSWRMDDLERRMLAFVLSFRRRTVLMGKERALFILHAFLVLAGCHKSLRPGEEIDVTANDELTIEIAQADDYWLDIAATLSPMVEGVGPSAKRPGAEDYAPPYWFGFVAPGQYKVGVAIPRHNATGQLASTTGVTRARLIRLPPCKQGGTLIPGQRLTVHLSAAHPTDPRGGCSEVAVTIGQAGSHGFRLRVEGATSPPFVESVAAAYLVDGAGVTIAPSLAFEPSSTEVRLAPGTYRLRLLSAGDQSIAITSAVGQGEFVLSPAAAPAAATPVPAPTRVVGP
jgi:hypothetical protein